MGRRIGKKRKKWRILVPALQVLKYFVGITDT